MKRSHSVLSVLQELLKVSHANQTTRLGGYKFVAITVDARHGALSEGLFDVSRADNQSFDTKANGYELQAIPFSRQCVPNSMIREAPLAFVLFFI